MLAPLDVTHQVMLDPDDIARIGGYGGGAQLFADSYITYQQAYCRLGGVCHAAPIHDAHPVVYLLEPEMYTVEDLALQVLVSAPGEAAHGMSLLDRRGARGSGARPANESTSSVSVMMGVDADAFRATLHARLSAGAATLLNPDSECHHTSRAKEEL